MKVNRLLIVLITSICILGSCQTETRIEEKLDHQDDQNLTYRLDSIGNNFIEQEQVMGISIAVAKQGEIIYSNGFGHIDSARSEIVNPEHIFLLASISKLVGATMVMKLVEENKLSLVDTLARLLPDFPNKEQAGQISLKQLLDHTAGLRDYASVVDSVYEVTGIDPTLDDYYDFFGENELDFEPSTHFNYSNSGFVLMAEIVERVTGNSFESELDRIINSPTGLNLKLIKDNISNPKLTSLFELGDSTINFKAHWPWIKGDGGITATARDLSLFPFYWSNGTIISRNSFDQQITPTMLSDGVSTAYGLGVRTGVFESETVVGHTGGNKTTLAIMKFFPEKELSVVVFVNTDNTPTDAIYIAGFVSLAVLDKEFPDLSELEVKSPPLSRFVGKYQATNSFYYGPGDLTIVKYDGDPNLYRKRPNSAANGQKLYYLGNNEFGFDPYPMDRLQFQVDAKGNVVAFNAFWNGLRKGGLFRKIE